MSSLLSSLGIEWKLLVAQLINFGILAFVLFKLIYKPLLKVLDERANTAKEALDKSNSIEARLEEIKESESKIIAEARKAGEKIIKDAEEAGLRLRTKLEEDATKASARIVKDAESKIEAESVALREAFKKDAIKVVADAIDATVGKYLDADAKAKLSEEANKEAVKLIK